MSLASRMRVGCAALLASASASAFAFTPADLMQALAGVPAAEVRFTETRTSSLLKAPLVLEGRLGWRRPDRLEREVRSPWHETSVISGATMTMTDRNGAQRTMRVPDGAPGALLDALRATLAGDLSTLERHFAVTTGGSLAQWTLTLSPRDPALGALVGRVDFAGRAAAIERIEVLEANGDRSVTLLRALPK